MTLKVNNTTVITNNLDGNFANTYFQKGNTLVIGDLPTAPTVGCFAGTACGFTAGGWNSDTSNIETFSFSSDGNATCVAALSANKYALSGQSSDTHGYVSGQGSTPAGRCSIEKFAFASPYARTNVGNLSPTGNYRTTGHEAASYGYVTGGPGHATGTEKFPFASDEDAVTVADSSTVYNTPSGGADQNSGTFAYITGGGDPNASSNGIQKFPLVTEDTWSDVGDLTQARGTFSAGHSSSTHGYTAGGEIPPGSNVIDKFPFASDTNASDVGDLAIALFYLGASTSTTNGYTMGGGRIPSPRGTNHIQKYPFATDTNASDIGNLVAAHEIPAGNQF